MYCAVFEACIHNYAMALIKYDTGHKKLILNCFRLVEMSLSSPNRVPKGLGDRARAMFDSLLQFTMAQI